MVSGASSASSIFYFLIKVFQAGSPVIGIKGLEVVGGFGYLYSVFKYNRSKPTPPARILSFLCRFPLLQQRIPHLSASARGVCPTKATEKLTSG